MTMFSQHIVCGVDRLRGSRIGPWNILQGRGGGPLSTGFAHGMGICLGDRRHMPDYKKNLNEEPR